jgi:flagellar motor switch protein FliN/FliY
MDNEAKKKGANIFASAFADSLAEALGTATGAPWPIKVIGSPETPSNKGAAVNFRLTVEGAIAGECFVELYEPQASQLVAKLGKEPAAEAGVDPSEALANLLQSAGPGMAAALAGKYGSLRIQVDPVAGLAFGGMFMVPLLASQQESNVPVLLYFGAQLLEALSAGEETANKAEDAVLAAKNLKLVMDVELNVSLRFGQRQMPLREILELSNGSVIELDRMVDEPVELFLDGKLIARGEAVVVDGNYGLRVTEIPQPVASHFLN